MDVDTAREKNIKKAEAEAERGPARSEPDAAPIGDAIRDFHARGDLAFGIPAHRAGTGDVVPDAAAWAGEQAFRADPGMNNGVDTRHQSWQVEPTAMELFAQAVGADQTLFSTNGSTENVHVAMMAAVKPGETIVMARNGHKSAFSALVLSGARPVYVDPELEQSTSASALLLSSIDAARRQFQRDGEELLGRAIDHARQLREAIEAMPGLDLLGEEVTGGPGAFAFDPTHVTFDVVGLGLTGFSAADWLRRHRRIHVELADHRRVMVLITYADSAANVQRLIDALRAMVAAHETSDRRPIPDVPHPSELRMETVLLPRDAFLGATEMVPWREAAGRISAEMICPYPPGIPITAPGERLTQTVVDYLEGLAAAGVMVEGAADETLAELRVVS
jgi:arginine/lysine/ornithine decarboxylase